MGMRLCDFVNSKTYNLLTGRSGEKKVVLPPLPEPNHLYEEDFSLGRLHVEPGYTEEQLQAYAREAVLRDRQRR
jgi:hypothetical protein